LHFTIDHGHVGIAAGSTSIERRLCHNSVKQLVVAILPQSFRKINRLEKSYVSSKRWQKDSETKMFGGASS
jgi:hypothetical protein